MTTDRIAKNEDGSLSLVGELNHQSVPALLKQSNGIFNGDDNSEITIDLNDVVRCDSSGVALLIELTRRAKQRQKSLQFINVPAQMLEIAKVSGVDKILAM